MSMLSSGERHARSGGAIVGRTAWKEGHHWRNSEIVCSRAQVQAPCHIYHTKPPLLYFLCDYGVVVHTMLTILAMLTLLTMFTMLAILYRAYSTDYACSSARSRVHTDEWNYPSCSMHAPLLPIEPHRGCKTFGMCSKNGERVSSVSRVSSMSRVSKRLR